MTEEEAKTKWCPFARVAEACAPELTGANRFIDSDLDEARTGSMCLASGCMAWRGKSILHMGTGEDVNEGYCGLAGAPQ